MKDLQHCSWFTGIYAEFARAERPLQERSFGFEIAGRHRLRVRADDNLPKDCLILWIGPSCRIPASSLGHLSLRALTKTLGENIFIPNFGQPAMKIYISQNSTKPGADVVGVAPAPVVAPTELSDRLTSSGCPCWAKLP